MSSKQDILAYYALLGVEYGASPGEIRAAYRQKVKAWHPDCFPNDPAMQAEAGEKLKAINVAYAYLKKHGLALHLQARRERRSSRAGTVTAPTYDTVYCLDCREQMPAAERRCPACGADQETALERKQYRASESVRLEREYRRSARRARMGRWLNLDVFSDVVVWIFWNLFRLIRFFDFWWI